MQLNPNKKQEFRHTVILFSFYFIFVYSIQLERKQINVRYKSMLMTGFEPWTSGIGSDRSTN